MILGIAILGVLISTLGASLIESRMKKIRTENPKKRTIKKRLDDLELMNEDEVNLLNISINTLHRELKSQDIFRKTTSRSKCKHVNLIESLYCNMCGQSIRNM
jgi:voltage-gated potassium channel